MSQEERILVEAVPAATDEVRELISKVDRTLSAEYSPEQRHGLALDAIFQPHIRFFLARLSGKAVGCAASRCSQISRRSSACTCETPHVERGLHRPCCSASRWRRALQDLRRSAWRREIDRKRQYGCIHGRGRPLPGVRGLCRPGAGGHRGELFFEKLF